MAESLGLAVLELSTDASAFDKGIAEGEKKAQGLEKTFVSTAGAIKAALAAVGIGLSLAAVAQATIQAERSMRLLENAVRATGGAAGFTAEQLHAQAMALQEATTLSDEAVQAVQTRLLAFRNIQGEVFRDAVAAIIDFSEATGRDAVTATQTLGIALNNPAEALGRLRQAGIDVNEALRTQVERMAAAGDAAGAQRLILEELKKSYGGAAVAARDTLGGALVALKNRFEDVFLEVQGPGTRTLTNFINMVTEHLGALGALFSAVFAGIKAGVEGLIEELFFMGQGLTRLMSLDIPGAMEAFSTAVQTPGATIKNVAEQMTAAFNETLRSMGELQAQAAAPANIPPPPTEQVTLFTMAVEGTKKSMTGLVQQGFGGFGQSAGQAIVQGKNFGDSFTQVVTSMKTAFVAAVVEMTAKWIAFTALKAALNIATGGFGGFFQQGGNPPVGLPAVVGEAGPEVIVPRRPVTVVPMDQAAQAAQRAAPGGGVSIGDVVTHVHGVTDPEAIADQVGLAVMRRVRGMGEIAFARGL